MQDVALFVKVVPEASAKSETNVAFKWMRHRFIRIIECWVKSFMCVAMSMMHLSFSRGGSEQLISVMWTVRFDLSRNSRMVETHGSSDKCGRRGKVFVRMGTDRPLIFWAHFNWMVMAFPSSDRVLRCFSKVSTCLVPCSEKK